MNIRTVKASDIPKIHSINESAVPHVNSISIEEFESFLPKSSFFLVIEDEAKNLAGFMIVLGPGQVYDSENYRYFSEHYERFDYVDRIVIAEGFRGRGFGTALYDFLTKHSIQPRITCEVNIDPPNRESLQFHGRLGFKEVAEQESENGKKWVRLLVMEKPSPA